MGCFDRKPEFLHGGGDMQRRIRQRPMDEHWHGWRTRELRLDVRSWLCSVWNFVRQATAAAVAAALPAAVVVWHARFFPSRQRRKQCS